MSTVITPALIAQARNWLADLDWADREHIDFAVLTAEEVQWAVERHYHGGWAGFVADGAEVAS